MTDIHFYCVSLNATQYEEFVIQICRENQTTRFAVNKFFTKSCGLCDNVENNVESDRQQRPLHDG
jgi:hypothetical protein